MPSYSVQGILEKNSGLLAVAANQPRRCYMLLLVVIKNGIGEMCFDL